MTLAFGPGGIRPAEPQIRRSRAPLVSKPAEHFSRSRRAGLSPLNPAPAGQVRLWRASPLKAARVRGRVGLRPLNFEFAGRGWLGFGAGGIKAAGSRSGWAGGGGGGGGQGPWGEGGGGRVVGGWAGGAGGAVGGVVDGAAGRFESGAQGRPDRARRAGDAADQD